MRAFVGPFTLALLLCLTAAAADPAAVAITHVTVIDATGAPSKPDQTVVLRGGRIAAIGKNVTIPRGATVVEGRGKFLIPGLWDMHTHVAGISADPAWGREMLLLYLAHGVTGIRDMAGDVDTLLAWKREQAAGRLPGPRLVVCGPFLDGSAQGFSRPGDVIEVKTPEEARARVRELKARGVDFIKIGSSLSKEVFFAIAEEARRSGIPFAGHVPDAVSVEAATDAGMRSMEHLFGMLWAVSGDEPGLRRRAAEASAQNDREALARLQDELERSYDPARADALFAKFRKNGTWIVPTLVWTSITGSMDTAPPDPHLQYMPASLQEAWGPAKVRTLVSPRGLAYYSRKAKNDLRLTGQLHRAGVPILAGSDSLDPMVFPGDSLHRELQLLVRSGFTPMEALQAATRDAAVFLGWQARMGTVEAGKAADLVLLDADPLADIANTQQIAGVMQGGRYFPRAELEEMLKGVAARMATVR